MDYYEKKERDAVPMTTDKELIIIAKRVLIFGFIWGIFSTVVVLLLGRLLIKGLF